MTDRQLLGWAACLALGVGLILLALPLLLVLLPDSLRVADPDRLLTLGLYPAVVALAGGIAAWRTRPGKAAAMAGGMMLFAWLMRRALDSVPGGLFIKPLDSILGSSAVTAVLAMGGGAAAWRTRPGKVAVIGGLLLVVATVVVVCGVVFYMMSRD